MWRLRHRFHAWHFFVLASILLATVAVVMTRRSTPENLILLSFTIAAAGLTAAALYRMLLPLTTSDLAALDQPMTDRYRATLERDKALTLRTIKELEFDHAMGKLSQKDFDEMVGRLRQRALSLMKQLDEGRSLHDGHRGGLARRMATTPSTRRSGCLCLRRGVRRRRGVLQEMRREGQGMTVVRVLAFAAVMLASGSAAAQMPSAAGAQMPDPKAMSGVPLPTSDLPPGTLTVRVVSGRAEQTDRRRHR